MLKSRRQPAWRRPVTRTDRTAGRGRWYTGRTPAARGWERRPMADACAGRANGLLNAPINLMLVRLNEEDLLPAGLLLYASQLRMFVVPCLSFRCSGSRGLTKGPWLPWPATRNSSVTLYQYKRYDDRSLTKNSRNNLKNLLAFRSSRGTNHDVHPSSPRLATLTVLPFPTRLPWPKANR
jgi:hypothetical protein